jgi:WD40 repeat protein
MEGENENEDENEALSEYESSDDSEEQKNEILKEKKDSDKENKDDKDLERGVQISYIRKFTGHVNIRTIKEVNFFGPSGEYVVSGSDDGNFFIWEKESGQLENVVEGDSSIVNCVQGHPLGFPFLAVSGIDASVKLFEPGATHRAMDSLNVKKIVQKNTKQLQKGRVPHIISEETMMRLFNLMREEGAEIHVGAHRIDDCNIS